jgi:hypothetical protein
LDFAVPSMNQSYTALVLLCSVLFSVAIIASCASGAPRVG